MFFIALMFEEPATNNMIARSREPVLTESCARPYLVLAGFLRDAFPFLPLSGLADAPLPLALPRAPRVPLPLPPPRLRPSLGFSSSSSCSSSSPSSLSPASSAGSTASPLPSTSSLASSSAAPPSSAFASTRLLREYLFLTIAHARNGHLSANLYELRLSVKLQVTTHP